MSDYESIHGTRVKYLTSDPTLDSSVEGQVWYNSTSGTNKALVQIKAWSSGADIATPRRYLAGCGLQTSALAFGGLNPGSNLNSTEEYSGFTWNTGGNLTTAVGRHAGAGTQTAGLSFGGQSTGITGQTEEYGGASWTSGGTMNTARSSLAGAGLQTAGLAFGGNEPALSNKTEEYDGSSWTASGTLNTARKFLAGCGTQTAGLAFGGTPGSGNLADTEEYNGSSWTASNDLNTAGHGLAGAGSQDNALAFAGSGRPTATEEYDGTIWTTSPATLANGRQLLGGAGTRAAGLGFGGYGVPVSAKTEEYNSNINAFTSAAFASGGALSTSRAQFGSAKHGTQNAGLAFGGFNWPNSNRSETEEYGGSSWTSGGALPAAQRQMGGTGTQTAALGYGGQPGFPNTTTLEYNGSSWTSGGALNSGGNFMYGSASGTQTAGLRSGSGTAASTTVEEYNGSSWTSANAMSVARVNSFVDGAQTATIITAGEAPAAPDATGSVTRLTEEYDGTNWSSGTSSLFFLSSGGVSGGAAAPTAFMITGGDGPEVTNNTGATQEYDGTAFTNTANLASPRRQLNGGGTQAAGLVFGGTEASSTALTATEEYTGSTSTVTASTLTTS